MSAHAVDLAIVGGGSAGFAAAVTAADLGAKAAIIESGTLGGTCVNVGCVPSKTLLRAAEVRHRASHHAFAGVSTRSDGLDFGAVARHKDALVAQLQKQKYLDVLAGMRSVTLVPGRGRLHPDGGLEVDGRPLPARAIVIATGAAPWAPPIPGHAATPFLTSTEALSRAQAWSLVRMISPRSRGGGLRSADAGARVENGRATGSREHSAPPTGRPSGESTGGSF